MQLKRSESNANSFTSFGSSQSGRSFTVKADKYELRHKFYEKFEDFRSKVMLHKDPNYAVYRARCKYSGAVVVLKGYSHEILTPLMRQRVWCEVQLLQGAQCPFMVKCLDAFEDQGWWWLVLENCACGDLLRILQQQEGRRVDEGWLVSQVVLPTLQALAYCHEEGIIHRDVKPEHIVFNSEKVAKMSGFLLSCDTVRYGLPTDIVGSLEYVAPEVLMVSAPGAGAVVAAAKAAQHTSMFTPTTLALQDSLPTSYDTKVDIWSVGIMVFDVLVGQPPFSDDEPEKMVTKILTAEPTYPDFLSDEAVDFIYSALKKDPEERPSCRRLLAHPWLRQHLDWAPPEDDHWFDPIPDIDLTFYNAAHDGDDASMDDEDGERGSSRMVWYNPATWFQRRGDNQSPAAGGANDDAAELHMLHEPSSSGNSVHRGLLSKPGVASSSPEMAKSYSGGRLNADLAESGRFKSALSSSSLQQSPGLPRAASPSYQPVPAPSPPPPPAPPASPPRPSAQQQQQQQQQQQSPRDAFNPVSGNLLAGSMYAAENLINLASPSASPRQYQTYLQPFTASNTTSDVQLSQSTGRRQITPQPPPRPSSASPRPTTSPLPDPATRSDHDRDQDGSKPSSSRFMQVESAALSSETPAPPPRPSSTNSGGPEASVVVVPPLQLEALPAEPLIGSISSARARAMKSSLSSQSRLGSARAGSRPGEAGG